MVEYAIVRENATGILKTENKALRSLKKYGRMYL